MPDNQFSNSVDSILENLKQQQPGLPQSDQSVTDILADLGLENKAAAKQQERAEKRSGAPSAPKEPQGPSTQTFWNTREIRIQNEPKNPSKSKRSEPITQENEQPSAPRLSDTIQMDQEFQKFFSQSIAVIPDLKEEQEKHPGFFARFVRRKKSEDVQPEEQDEGISGRPEQEDQPTGEVSLELPPEQEEDWEQPLPQVELAREDKGHKQEQVKPQQPKLEQQPVYQPKVECEPVPELIEPQPEPEMIEPQPEPEPEQVTEMPAQQQTQEPDEQPENTVEDITGNIQIPLADTNTIPFEPRQADLVEDVQAQEELGETQNIDLPQEQKTSRFKFPRFWGKEEQGENTFEEPAQPEYVEDYENPGDAPAVQQDLEHLRFVTAIRTLISGVIGVMLLYLGLAVGESPLPPIAAVDPDVAPAAFLAINLLMLLAACAVNWRVFVNGIRGIWDTPTPDTIPALASIGAALQLVVLLMSADSFDAAKMTIFAAPAVLLLCFSALGKYLLSGVFRSNFEMLTSGSDHVAAFAVEDQELSHKLADGLGEPEPRLLASRPTTLIRGFLRRSFSVRASDYMLQKMSWLLAAAALLATAITLFSQHSAAMAFTVLAGTLCLGGPASVTLMSAVPSMLMQKSAARVGAVIPGWDSIEEIGGTNMVVVGAKDLFPTKSVRLHAIKTFEKERIDLAILYAASVLVEGCDTLRDVFMNIIQGKTEILFPVENLQNDPGYGFTAWVQHNRIIIGNRAMMEKQGVEIPSLDYENRYTKGVKKPIYLAVSGRLFGMFLVSYKADEQAANVLSELRHHGISVLVKSDDFSLNSQMITEIYGLPEGCLKVLNAAERRDLEPMVEYSQYTEGCMGHLGSFSSFVGGLLAASDAASAERLSSMVQAAGVAVSAVLSLLLAFTGGIAELALPALILYQAAWTVLTLIIALLKRY